MYYKKELRNVIFSYGRFGAGCQWYLQGSSILSLRSRNVDK